jgi:hypothetical protein
MWTGISIGFYLIYTISKYREEKIDHRLFPIFAHLMDRGKKSKKKGYYSDLPAEEFPRDIRQIINPARPSPHHKKAKK